MTSPATKVLQNVSVPDIEAHDEDLYVEFCAPPRTLRLSISDLDKEDGEGYIVDDQSLRVLNNEIDSYLIYSERVTLKGATSLPGKELGIFCSFLRIAPSGGTLDVSGHQGDNADPQNKGAGHGQDGGRIWLYIENLEENLLDHLELRADGGDGGEGFPGKDPKTWNGAKGGNGGHISIYYGGTLSGKLRSDLNQITQLKTWTQQAEQAQALFSNTKDPTQGSPLLKMEKDFPDSFVEECTQTCSQYTAFATSLKLLSEAIDKVLALKPTDVLHPRPLDATRVVIMDCKEKLVRLMGRPRPPSTTPNTTDISRLKTCCDTTNVWYISGASAKEKAMKDSLTDCIQLLRSILDSEVDNKSHLWDRFQSIAYALECVTLRILSKLQHRVASVNGGKAGRPAKNTGPIKGPNGKKGMVCSKELLFDGGISDLDVDIVFAFPDQCQMLMNQADAYYFSQEIKKASVVYSRLIRRLAFAPTLNNLTAAKPVPDKPSPSKLALAEAYKRACDDWKLVISSEKQPVLQLESILNQARSKLNRIALGQDIFAHPANWVPRDAFQVYFNDAAQAMKNFDQLSNRLSQYKKAIGVEVKALIEQITTNAENVDGIEAAQIRINELTGTSGILLTNVNKINILHRAVQGQRGTIQKVFENVEQDLRDKFSFDPQSILDGMASFCMMPSKLFAGAEALTLAYKAMTTVESIGGVPVPKNYAIKQLVQLRKEMGSQIARISDLTKCISETKDGTIDVEDPGALKILATSDDIEHILSEYGSAIRGDNAEALKAALKGYIDAVIARNNVILEYNAGLQLLEEAKANKAYHQTQIDEEGKRIINSELSQRLPLIYSWLKKIVDDNWFTAVQCLDNAARATRFWGLVDVDCYKLLDNRYESRSEALKSVFNAIWDACRSRMTSFGNVLPANWPSAGKGQGKFLALTDMELQSLKTPRNIGGKTRYSVSVNFQPRDFLTGQSCVRLYLVRFWIIGATVKPDIPNRNLLSVNIKHMGAESFWNEWGRRFDFVHDCVDMSFKYNARMVQILDDCKYSDDVVLMQTELTKEYAGDKLDLTKEGWKSTDATTHALIGPFSTWYIELLCENDCNPGLDLSKVSEAYLEICTTSRPSLE